VPRDIDAENIEKSGAYTGRYFILGGTIPVLDQEPEVRIRATALKNRLTSDAAISEVIIAMNLTPEGEHTEEYIRGLIAPIVESRSLTISTLGRGMSTGTELEYSDPLTLKSALTRRIKLEK
jgi:recombination protein RecR